MTRLKIGGVALGLMIGVLAATPANAWKRGNVDVLAVLPAATGSVEGLTVGPDDGNIYVPTFGFNTQGELSGPATLFVISPNGKLINAGHDNDSTRPASAHMLGLGFNPSTKDLLVIDFGANNFTAGDVLKVDPKTGQASLFINPIPGSGLNALTFDKDGNVYVSDSFNGVIWKTGPQGGTATQWCSDPLLRPGTGLTPPFGANGIAFSNDGNVLVRGQHRVSSDHQDPGACRRHRLLAVDLHYRYQRPRRDRVRPRRQPVGLRQSGRRNRRH